MTERTEIDTSAWNTYTIAFEDGHTINDCSLESKEEVLDFCKKHGYSLVSFEYGEEYRRREKENLAHLMRQELQKLFDSVLSDAIENEWSVAETLKVLLDADRVSEHIEKR